MGRIFIGRGENIYIISEDRTAVTLSPRLDFYGSMYGYDGNIVFEQGVLAQGTSAGVQLYDDTGAKTSGTTPLYFENPPDDYYSEGVVALPNGNFAQQSGDRSESWVEVTRAGVLVGYLTNGATYDRKPYTWVRQSPDRKWAMYLTQVLGGTYEVVRRAMPDGAITVVPIQLPAGVTALTGAESSLLVVQPLSDGSFWASWASTAPQENDLTMTYHAAGGSILRTVTSNEWPLESWVEAHWGFDVTEDESGIYIALEIYRPEATLKPAASEVWRVSKTSGAPTLVVGWQLTDELTYNAGYTWDHSVMTVERAVVPPTPMVGGLNNTRARFMLGRVR